MIVDISKFIKNSNRYRKTNTGIRKIIRNSADWNSKIYNLSGNDLQRFLDFRKNVVLL